MPRPGGPTSILLAKFRPRRSVSRSNRVAVGVITFEPHVALCAMAWLFGLVAGHITADRPVGLPIGAKQALAVGLRNPWAGGEVGVPRDAIATEDAMANKLLVGLPDALGDIASVLPVGDIATEVTLPPAIMEEAVGDPITIPEAVGDCSRSAGRCSAAKSDSGAGACRRLTPGSVGEAGPTSPSVDPRGKVSVSRLPFPLSSIFPSPAPSVLGTNGLASALNLVTENGAALVLNAKPAPMAAGRVSAPRAYWPRDVVAIFIGLSGSMALRACGLNSAASACISIPVVMALLACGSIPGGRGGASLD